MQIQLQMRCNVQCISLQLKRKSLMCLKSNIKHLQCPLNQAACQLMCYRCFKMILGFKTAHCDAY